MAVWFTAVSPLLSTKPGTVQVLGKYLMKGWGSEDTVKGCKGVNVKSRQEK